MEIVLEETISFSELIGTVVANNADHQSLPKVSLGGAIPPSPPPPNINIELETLRKEILRLQNEIRRFSQPGPVPPNIHKTVLVGTVPPNNELKISSRKKKPIKGIAKRRGVEP